MSERIKVTADPFEVPEHVKVGGEDERRVYIPVAALDSEDLNIMAEQWLNHLYASVGRANPFVTGRSS